MMLTGEILDSKLDSIDADVLAIIEYAVTDAKRAAQQTAKQVTADVYIKYIVGT